VKGQAIMSVNMIEGATGDATRRDDDVTEAGIDASVSDGDAPNGDNGTPQSEIDTPMTRRDVTDDMTEGEIVTITEAHERLGLSVRTVQRRLDRGELKAVERDGKRMVLLPSHEATGDAIQRDSDASFRSSSVSNLQNVAQKVESDTSEDDFGAPGVEYERDTTRLGKLVSRHDEALSLIEPLQRDVAALKAVIAGDMMNRLQESLAGLATKEDVTEAIEAATSATLAPLVEQMEKIAAHSAEHEQLKKAEISAALTEVLEPYTYQLAQVAEENRYLRAQLAKAKLPFWLKWFS
jgi:hypothetical protein